MTQDQYSMNHFACPCFQGRNHFACPCFQGQNIAKYELCRQRRLQADIKVLEMPLLDTTYHKDLLGTFIADLVLSVLSFSAHKEREKILERQAAGIAAAKAKGVVFGRKPVDIPDEFPYIYQQWRDGDITGVYAAELCGFSLKTLYNLTIDWRREKS